MHPFASCLAALFCLLPPAAATASPVPLKLVQPGETVLFLGDSITNGGFYIACIDTFLRLEAPQRDLHLVNLGLGSETASGLSESDHPFPRPCIHQRLEATLDLVRPDVVFFCYGMNDGIYHPLSEERFAAYRDGIDRLVAASTRAGARVIALTPPPFDAPSMNQEILQPDGHPSSGYKAPYRDYDRVLQTYGTWLRTECEGLTATIDLHKPVADLNAACRRVQPAFLSGDGIHPRKTGHLAMALEILEALGFDRDHARTVLEAESGLSLDPARLAVADPKLSPPASRVLQLSEARLRLLLTSFREHTGHGHPNKAKSALPPSEAMAQAAALEAQIRSAIRSRETLHALVAAKVHPHLEAGDLAGAVTLVARDGRIEDLQAHGFADRESHQSMDTDQIFRIHSFTKALTSAAALILYEQGKFAFDAPISRWLPEFAAVQVGDEPARQPILVRHLLTHSSGISYSERTVFEAGDLAAVTSAIARVPLAHEPGQGWTYGASIDVLGRLIEIWSGQPYETFLREQLLHPLGMSDTDFHVPPAKRSRLATLYKADPANPSQLLPSEAAGNSEAPVPATSPLLCMPGGGLYSTATDYHRFLAMIQNQGQWEGRRYLQSSTVRLMRTNQLDPAAGWLRFGNEERDGFGFGFGFNVVVRPSQWAPDAKPGEFGWGGLCSCHYWMHPEGRLTVITLEQTLPYRWTLEHALKEPLYELPW